METTREQQMTRLEDIARLKTTIEDIVDQYRDFPREELTNGQFAIRILLAIVEMK